MIVYDTALYFKRKEKMKYQNNSYRFLIKYIKEHYEHKCHYCGKKITDDADLTVDHLVPLSRGGRHELSNLKICCADCNFNKGNMTESEYCNYLKTGIVPQNINHLFFRYDADMDISSIKIPGLFKGTGVKSKKVKRVIDYYNTNHAFEKPIIVNQKNNMLVDGYARYKAAEILQISNVPVEFYIPPLTSAN
jgi:5-methylcytosine-specific restriction protein A